MFSGETSGILVAASSARPFTNENPDAGSFNLSEETVCSFFLPYDNAVANDYVALIHGAVDGKSLTLSVEINGDNAAYLKPGVKLVLGAGNWGGGAQLQLAGDETPRYHTVSNEDTYVTLNADRRSGTIVAWFDDPGDSQNAGHDVIRVQGTWRCGKA